MPDTFCCPSEWLKIFNNNGRWRPHLHDLGEVEVKHGERVHVFNFYTDDAGNSDAAKESNRRNRMQSSAVTAPLIKMVPKTQRPSICVLPFANMSGDPEQEYFSDGISEDIITDLIRVSALPVVARNTAFAFKGERSMSDRSRSNSTSAMCSKAACAKRAAGFGSRPS